MARAKTKNRIERLDRLASRLKIDEPIVMQEIADEFSISLSTLNRDIRILKERGLPIETDIGRGGGVRINPNWQIGRVSFSLPEVIDLLISLASIGKMKMPMMFGNASSIRAKLISSFSKSQQAEIKKLALRIKVGPTSSPQTIATYCPEPSELVEKIQSAFLFRKVIEFNYRRADGDTSQRQVEPHYMVLNHPIWYILGWDHGRQDIRTFRMDRMSQLDVMDQTFNLLGWEKFEKTMNGNRVTSP